MPCAKQEPPSNQKKKYQQTKKEDTQKMFTSSDLVALSMSSFSILSTTSLALGLRAGSPSQHHCTRVLREFVMLDPPPFIYNRIKTKKQPQHSKASKSTKENKQNNTFGRSPFTTASTKFSRVS
jgi:hypothetical protein